MRTNIGIIKNLRKAWGQPNGQVYATARLEPHDAVGEKVSVHSVGVLDILLAEAYRKFCSASHVGYDRTWGYRAQHASGCAACHFQRNEDGTYQGQYKAIYGKKGMPGHKKTPAVSQDLSRGRPPLEGVQTLQKARPLTRGNGADEERPDVSQRVP